MTDARYNPPPYQPAGEWPLHYRIAADIPLYGSGLYADIHGLSERQRLGLGVLDLLSRGSALNAAAAQLNLNSSAAKDCLRGVREYFGADTPTRAASTAFARGALQVWHDAFPPALPDPLLQTCTQWAALPPKPETPFFAAMKGVALAPPFESKNSLHFVRMLYARGIGKLASNAFRAPAILFSLPPHPSGVTPQLTPRQKQVLTLQASGLKGSATADALHIQPHTVKSLIRNLLTRLHAANMQEATTKGIITGNLEAGRTSQSVRLSPRQLYSALGIALGHDNQAIRDVLFATTDQTASIQTVKYEIRTMRGKIKEAAPADTLASRGSIAAALFRLSVFATEQYQQHYSVLPRRAGT